MQKPSGDEQSTERQLTFGHENCLLTNVGVWSRDHDWIYYDTRSDIDGSVFDGERIRRVNVATGKTETVFQASRGSKVGVVTASPNEDSVVFIHGPDSPTDQWQYSAWHRRGVVFDHTSQSIKTLDARNLVPPFTPGALRGGSHVHVFSGDGRWVSFTYEDHVLESVDGAANSHRNQRNVGVASSSHGVSVPQTHRRNHDGTHFSVLVTQTFDDPQAGSDQISRAYSDAWIGTNGYEKRGGSRQRRALAFIGDCRDRSGARLPELFVVDVPDDVTVAGDRPLAGTPTTRPCPPRGTVQRRLTFTESRRYPGLGDVRHWPRSSPDGSRIAFLMKDDAGQNQLWTIDPMGENLRQVTQGKAPVSSAFTFRCDGRTVACVIDGHVCEVDVNDGKVVPLTEYANSRELSPITDKAVVYSPSGNQIAFNRIVSTEGEPRNQIFLVDSRIKSVDDFRDD